MNKKKLAWVLTISLAMAGCQEKRDIPVGYWISERGRPDILITDEGNKKYTATVYHILSDNRRCPVKYPVILNSTGAYILAEGRILISYSSENDKLFLSPGGNYHRRTKK